jgi:DNA helicase II / ATP-dependent DNA helicase PcrA
VNTASTAAYLDRLNPEQRRAVEHGDPEFLAVGPLLIIAGAGSGKTNTLAHRVAHLLVKGIDPHRMLLLTFSRRAAPEMMRRVDRIAAAALRERAPPLAEQLAWGGRGGSAINDQRGALTSLAIQGRLAHISSP